MYRMSLRSPSSTLLSKRRSLLRKRASLPTLPQAMSSDDLRLGDSATVAVPRRHKRVDRVGTRERERVFPTFRWPGQYDHSLRGKYNNEADPFVFRCRPGRVSFLRGVREGGHR